MLARHAGRIGPAHLVECLEERRLLSLATPNSIDPSPSPSVSQLTERTAGQVSVVTVVAENPKASPSEPGVFTFTRPARDKATTPVTIHYTLSGTARNGKDYQRLSGTATILARHTWVSISVVPITTSSVSRNVVLTITPGAGYTIGSRRTATILLAPATEPNPTPNPTPNPQPTDTWPLVPFPEKDYRGTIYVNQFGNAILPRQALAAGGVSGYDVFFDDPGTVTFQTSGVTQTAFYKGSGQPIAIGSSGTASTTSALQGPVLSKELVHVAVRGQAAKYGMVVLGVPQTYFVDIPILRRTNGGHAHTFISNPYDSDFIRFTTTRPGDWTVSLAPTDIEDGRGLDPSMIVFDSSGMPVAGSFTEPINRGGVGQVEVCTLKNLPGGATYYIRVDGAGDSVGQTNIQVQRTPMPVVSVKAKVNTAAADGSKAGQVVVSRSARVGFSSPLQVYYSVSGTAVNGVDYRRLSGSIVIPARQLSATINVLAKPGTKGLAGKVVFVTLKPRADYDIGGRPLAGVTFAANRRPAGRSR